jgi:glycosyltransferase involved in cell wall biosynthesis
MRIGIDAKWFFTGPVSSRVVLQNLLPELFRLFPEHEWIIFLDKKDRQLTFPIHSPRIEIHYVWADINMLSNLFLLSGKLKSLKVEVMVYQTFPSWRRAVPALSFIHDVLYHQFPEFFTWKEKLYFFPLSWLSRHRSDRLIATTEYVSSELLKYNYASRKSLIDIVPLAVNQSYQPQRNHDPARLSALREKYQLPDKFLLFVGRLNVRKNIENLLKALPLLHDRKISLVIVGQADWKTPDLDNILCNQDIRNRTHLAGAMSDEELILTYSLASIFCYPSFAEGFGLPPLEAMASGIPVIVSDTTALPEVCGNAAVFIHPHQPDSIAEAINELLENESLYADKKNQGLQRARQFTWEKSAEALMQSILNTVALQR